MKTTLELPDALLRRAKIRAARQGTTLRAVVTQALESAMAHEDADAAQAPWRRHFGALRRLHEETAVINAAVQDAFESIDEDAWR